MDSHQARAGQAMCAQAVAPNEHATAAQLWAEAKQRLFLRADEKDHAIAQHAAAVVEEKEAWERLEYAAGRAAPKAAEANCKPGKPGMYGYPG